MQDAPIISPCAGVSSRQTPSAGGTDRQTEGRRANTWPSYHAHHEQQVDKYFTVSKTQVGKLRLFPFKVKWNLSWAFESGQNMVFPLLLINYAECQGGV